MADYRFSAKVISRSKGQSSVASAAYRSASKLHDNRTGEIHSFDRKGGVLHSEILAPANTPEWMHDRAQLWNAVEAVERRKDAQLAREVQLSLPHELTPEQRLTLARDFVQEQFVNHGMIADIAIHAPDKNGDQRNHHAHVMLTMREITAEGFGKKSRDWNSPELLAKWREDWAQHQNRALERHGHAARVDHRSYEAQGIDREPSQHLGSVASDMERKGKRSRIGDENRRIANDNSARAKDHAELANIAREKWKFGQWAEYKRAEIEAAQDLAKLDLSQKHDRQKSRLEAELTRAHATAKATIRAEMEAIERRLQAVGVRKILRDTFGRTKSDSVTREQLSATLKNIDQRETEQRQALARRQQLDIAKEVRRQDKNRDRLEKGIQTARERREATDWQPREQSPPKAPNKALRAKFEPEAKPQPAPKQSRPWESKTVANEDKRPWESDLFKKNRSPKRDR